MHIREIETQRGNLYCYLLFAEVSRLRVNIPSVKSWTWGLRLFYLSLMLFPLWHWEEIPAYMLPLKLVGIFLFPKCMIDRRMW